MSSGSSVIGIAKSYQKDTVKFYDMRTFLAKYISRLVIIIINEENKNILLRFFSNLLLDNFKILITDLMIRFTDRLKCYFSLFKVSLENQIFNRSK